MNGRSSSGNSVARIATLDLVAITLERLDQRHAGLPGIAVLYGPAGWGKTFAANVLANQRRAYFVQMASAWRSKDLLERILIEMGVRITDDKGRPFYRTVSKLLDAVNDQLGNSNRPLIIDEFDHCAKSDSMVELIRDIYEGSRGSLLLVGEELLPKKLERWERFHSRVLTWAPAQKVSLADAEMLAPIYCPSVTLDQGILEMLVKNSSGSVRRVCTNLDEINEQALLMGFSTVTADKIEQLGLSTGRAPERRV